MWSCVTRADASVERMTKPISDGGQVGSERRKVRLTRATESLPTPLLFWAGSLLTISVPIRVRNDSRMCPFYRSTRGRGQKLETRYTRAWPRGEP